MKIANSFFISYNRIEKGKLRDWANHMGIPVLTENGEKMKEYYE